MNHVTIDYVFQVLLILRQRRQKGVFPHYISIHTAGQRSVLYKQGGM